MKSKCSFILKATTALVLCFLMLFGTVTTSLAAVVENADTGAEADVADEAADVEVVDEGAEADVAETGKGKNWYGNVFFRAPDSWNLSTYPNVQVWAVQSTTASSGGKKYSFLLGNMSIVGSTSNSRLYHYYVNTNHSTWDDNEYLAFTANSSNWNTGAFYISTCGQYTAPYDYGVSNNNGSYLFAPSNASNNTASNNNTMSGSYNGTNRDVLKKNQDFYVYTNGSASATGGKVDVTAHYVNGSSFNGSSAIASSDITVDSSDTGAHQQYGGAVEGTKVTMTATANTGYDFAGYYDAATGGNQLSSSTSYSYYVFGTKSVYARYTPKTYTISYNKGANGTGTVSSTTKTHGVNATLSSSTFTRTGYTQTGWSTSDGGSKAYDLGGSYTTNASTTLYPHWSANTYTITYNKGTYGSGTVASTSKTHGVDATLSSNTFTRTGYTQKGWSTAAAGTSKAYDLGGTYTANAAATLYPYWEINTYNVKKTESGASGGTVKVGSTTIGTSNTSVNYGTNYTVTVDAPSGYNVKSVSGVSGTTSGLNTGSVSITGVTIDAATTIAVTYVSAGSCGFTLSASSGSVNIGATTSFTATPNSYHSSGTISVSSSDTSVATVSKSGNTYTVTGVAPGTATITVSCTDTGNSPATYTVTVNTPTISVADQSGKKIGDTYTITPTLTNPSTTGSVWTVVYTAADSNILSISDNSITRNKTGSCSVTASFRYNGVEKASKTFQNTSTDPTLSFATGTAKTMNVGETYTDVATGGNIGSSATGTVTYASDATAVATVSSAGVVTAKTPGEANITATYTVTCNSQTTTKTATYKVTVATPTVTFADFSLAKGDSKDLSGSATTSNPSGLTIAYSLKSAVTGVSISGSTVSVASSCTASSATVVASAENSAGTVVATAEATLTIEDPEMTITDINDGDTIYTTIGTNVSKSISNNFSGSYTITYNGSESTSSVATASVENGTLTITPAAKGTVEITVTASKESAVGASPDLLINKLNLVATGAEVGDSLVGTGISASQTFTVNVAEAEDYKLILCSNFTGDGSFSSIYIDYWHTNTTNNANHITRTAMTKIGTNESGQTVYAYLMPIAHYNALQRVVFYNGSSSTNSYDHTGYITTKSNGYYILQACDSQYNERTFGTWTHDITIPQVTIDDASTPLGTNYTLSATKVNEASVGKYKWTSATTSAATVTADTGTTASTTVVPVDAGSSLITVKAYAPQPTGWNAWEWADIVAGTDTATITVTADAKKLYFNNNNQFNSTGSYETGNTGGTLNVTFVTGGAAVTSGTTEIPHNTKVKIVANAADGYSVEKIEWSLTGEDNSWTDAGGNNTVDSTSGLTTAKTIIEFTVNQNYYLRATFKKANYITLYNSYEYKNGKWVFVAAPPKKVEVGSGATKRTFTYASGTDEQRGEENIKTESGAYYEGNKLLVYPGEKIALTYAGLASSDMIKGAFYNNAIRYSTEAEPDNAYVSREHNTGTLQDVGTADYPHGRYLSGDDDTEYDFALNTTLYAYPSYYTTSGYYDTVTANESNYVANIDQSEHTITWTAASDYLNIDLELSTKYQLHINGDDWSGLTIENMNDEGYYYQEEAFDKSVAPATDKQFKISIDNESDATGSYAFTGIGAEVSLNPDHPEPATGMAVTAKKSDGTDASTASEISYFLVSGNMPLSNVYITLPIEKTYLMKLSNTVATDSIDNKMMITQTTNNSTSSGTAPASYTGQVGTISAIPTYNNVEGSDISSDGNYWVNYTADANYKGKVYNSNNFENTGYYLAGGVNKSGTGVTAGTTIQYAFTYASGMDTKYSFVGWFEGSWSDDAYTVDYSKKLSGKTQFTYTPTKNTTVIAVVTRDLYLGGNFTSDGAYTMTSGEKTWSSNRILMEYDPTFVGSNGDKGRYYYTFDTVNTNTEYQFRVYDTKSGTETGSDNLTVWNAHIDDIHGYLNDNAGIADYRSKYDAGSGNWTTHGGFKFTNSTSQRFSEIKKDGTALSSTAITQNHTANGYGNPVTVYFYAYNSATSVDSTYQWSRAYVSEGRGIDAKSVKEGDSDSTNTTFNTPTASVANKTVNNQDVTVTAQATKYGNGNSNGMYEKIYECVVKEKDGQIVVTASPNDANVELQAFLVYNIETKNSEAVLGPFTESGTGDEKTYTGNITIPQNSKIYVVPIYKFTQAYITAQNLETHTVYVRTSDIDKDDWGGLVAMYSWGTDARYDSGRWPGQLMIPSDDGNSFYAPLTFMKNGLAGVTFNNYMQLWGSGNGNAGYTNFIGTYKSQGVSSVDYSGDGTHLYQAYDYREPISIIDNINAGGIYDSEDMDLTFALKSGNMTGAPTIDSAGSGAYNRADSFEYLTDRSGKYRVDLNGNKISTNPTETYRVVAWYTNAFKNAGAYDFTETIGTNTRSGTDYKGEYSIKWTVYNTNGEAVLSDSYLSAAYTDVYKSEMLTYIASEMIANDLPVSGKAVKIAYENPGTWSEAIRYAGQWYADGVNSLIQANVRVGVYSDGAWLPSDTNAPGYATATVRYDDMNTSIGEGYETESGCSGHSLINVTKTHATNRLVSFTVDDTNNFLGWYKYNETTEEYEPVNSSYKNATITPSFNSDITYYAFYSAQASYRVQYTGRDGSTKYFTAKGTDLTPAELATANQYLDDTERASDISTKLTKASDIRVFNKSYSITLSSPTKTAYTLTYTAVQSDATYKLTVYAYNDEGSLVLQSFDGKDYIEGTFNTEINLTSKAGKYLTQNHPSGQQYFQGWVKYDPSGNSFGSEIISTQALFGYSLTEDLTIAPVFASTKRSDEGTWAGYVDKNVITQELTAANTGIIYNDSILSFRYSAESQRKYTEETGIVIFAQANTATEAQKTAFDGILTSAKAKTYLDHMKSNNLSSAKLSSTKYGEAYVFYIETEELSALNRVDIFQKLDYAKFSGGRYMVAGYYGSTTRTISEVVTGDYTPHDYSRITGNHH